MWIDECARKNLAKIPESRGQTVFLLDVEALTFLVINYLLTIIIRLSYKMKTLGYISLLSYFQSDD